jgi:tRNA(Leu) C34 or U34 (ribose-2'-O)-methylase TrmL
LVGTQVEEGIMTERRGYAAIGLHMPKTPLNVGSVLRAAHCYGAALVAITGKRYANAPTDPQKAYRHIPLIHTHELREAVPFDCVPVAIDLLEGARALHAYTHPERAFYIFGPEDGTLGSAITDWCRDKVYVPTHHCMNLAAAVNVVLYDRMAKRLRESEQLTTTLFAKQPRRNFIS